MGIDTATMISGIGVVDNGNTLADFRYDVKLTHSEVLLSHTDKLLKAMKLKLQDFDGVCISLGPGSFTGLRIGLATAKGICFASGKPLVGVSTLDALAFMARGCEYPVVPIIDAKKYQIYAAVYDTGGDRIMRKTPYVAVELSELIRKIPQEVAFSGPGIDAFRPQLTKAMGGRAHFLRGEKTLPSGAAVAYLGWEKLKEGKDEDVSSLEPIYVRESEAELKFKNVQKFA